MLLSLYSLADFTRLIHKLDTTGESNVTSGSADELATAPLTRLDEDVGSERWLDQAQRPLREAL